MRKPLYWLSVAALITFAFLGLFVVIQQTLRIAANEPQRSMGQQISKRLEEKADPKSLINGHVDMKNDMSPFIIIYDQYGKVESGNGYLDGKVPQVPIGVLNAAKGHKINQVTWQPDEATRIAAVSSIGGEYYVLAGRNLNPTDNRIRSTKQWLIGLWVLSIALLIVAYKLLHRNKKNTVKTEKVSEKQHEEISDGSR